MKIAALTVLLSAMAPVVCAAAADMAAAGAEPALAIRLFEPASQNSEAKREESAVKLVPRKGGGGKSGSSSGSSSGSGRSGSSSGLGSSSSNSGGRTITGSGTKPAYGGGAYYGGGAAVPYRSGQSSPSGIKPLAYGALAGGAVAGVAFWPGVWYHPIYYYPYGHPYGYYNRTSDRNETKNVACACDESVECGCDENTNSTYMNDLLNNDTSKGLVSVADVNGSSTILINGTLDNGTTAAGGTESASTASGLHMLLQHAGWWPVAATVLAMVLAV